MIKKKNSKQIQHVASKIPKIHPETKNFPYIVL